MRPYKPGLTSGCQAPAGAEAAAPSPRADVSAPVTVPKAPTVNPWNKAPAPARQENDATESTQADAFPVLQSVAPKTEDVVDKMKSLSLAPVHAEESQTSTEAVTEERAEEKTSRQVYAEEEESDDTSDTDDSDAGEWITPENVVTHKSQDLGLAPAGYSAEGVFQPAAAVGKTRKDRGRKGKGKALDAKTRALDVACMTGDYAVQNVIMQIGLNLVGTGGKKMAQVKSWVLRCHACFK
jgi:RNA-binding protein NOB1